METQLSCPTRETLYTIAHISFPAPLSRSLPFKQFFLSFSHSVENKPRTSTTCNCIQLCPRCFSFAFPPIPLMGFSLCVCVWVCVPACVCLCVCVRGGVCWSREVGTLMQQDSFLRGLGCVHVYACVSLCVGTLACVLCVCTLAC